MTITQPGTLRQRWNIQFDGHFGWVSSSWLCGPKWLSAPANQISWRYPVVPNVVSDLWYVTDDRQATSGNSYNFVDISTNNIPNAARS